MNLERWDVVVRFLNGPLQWQGDMVMRGPVVRIGSNPGPGGLALEGYRALDDRHAVISAYQGGTVQIAPVGPNQVRTNEHENVDWNTIQPIRGPVFLSDGCAVHLGPPGRGATFTFVECRRLGVWQQQSLVSEAGDVHADQEESARSQVRQLDTKRKIPWWFVPGLAVLVFGTISTLGLVVLIIIQHQVEPLGPQEPGPDYYDYGAVFQITELNADIRAKNTGDAYKDFITSIDSAKANDPKLIEPLKGDPNLVDWVTRAEQMHIRSYKFWKRLDDARARYAMVLGKLRDAGLPEVLAGVPYQESGYNPDAKDRLLCAYGMWQFQPEIAKRNKLTVRGCNNRKTGGLWEPTELALPIRAIERADYVLDGHCAITSCAEDERGNAELATDAAIQNFKEPWNDPNFAASGAIVQMMIATHNAGYDDSKYRSNRAVSPTNIARAYKLYLDKTGKTTAPDFIGANITCHDASHQDKNDVQNLNNRCDGFLPSVTQTYVPYVIAQHLLAVCYYGTNYSDVKEFASYARYSATYCKAIKVPTPDEVRAKGS